MVCQDFSRQTILLKVDGSNARLMTSALVKLGENQRKNQTLVRSELPKGLDSVDLDIQRHLGSVDRGLRSDNHRVVVKGFDFVLKSQHGFHKFIRSFHICHSICEATIIKAQLPS